MGLKPDVIVVGGGIWGASTALHVVRSSPGIRVVVVDRAPALAAETTGQAAGQIGQLRANPLMLRAVGYTLELLGSFRERTGHDPGFVRSGSIHLALTADRMTALRAMADRVRPMGVAVEEVDGERARRLVPLLEPSALAGAVFLPGDAYVDAPQCARAYAAAAADGGAEFRFGTEVTGIRITGGRAVGIDTADGPLDAGSVVVTGGPWTGLLLAPLGFAVPVVPIRLQQMRTKPDPNLPAHHPVVRIPDASCYLRPERGGYLYGYIDPHPLAVDVAGGGRTIRTADIAVDEPLMAEARRRLAAVFPTLADFGVDQYRQGMVTCTPDANYALGPVPGVERLYLASGCSAMGIAGSAAVGSWLAECVIQGRPPAEIAGLDPARFGPQAADRGWLVERAREVYASYYSLSSRGATYGCATTPSST